MKCSGCKKKRKNLFYDELCLDCWLYELNAYASEPRIVPGMLNQHYVETMAKVHEECGNEEMELYGGYPDVCTTIENMYLVVAGVECDKPYLRVYDAAACRTWVQGIADYLEERPKANLVEAVNEARPLLASKYVS